MRQMWTSLRSSFQATDGGMWIKEEALVDSGAIDRVANSETLPHLDVESTPKSRRCESWACAGGKEIAKEYQIHLSWKIERGSPKKSAFKVGKSRSNICKCEKTPRYVARVVSDEAESKDR